jgi:sugar/nucleoside kinase (ribokinase family)
VLSQARGAKLTLSDTMNYWIARKPERVLEVLRAVDIALLNEEEARALAGETHLVRAADRLLEQGAKAVIIKKGEHGALFQSREDRFLAPAFPVAALNDPTGAGDSFAGGFLGWVARAGRVDRGILRQALIAGSVMASIAIEGFSPARLVETDGPEIAMRMSVLRDLVHFDLDSPEDTDTQP